MFRKILAVSLSFIIFLIVGCSQKDEIKNQPKMTANEIFEKKKECAMLSDDMLKYAKEFRAKVYEINEIFYSPKLNSCLFIADAGDEELLFDFFNRVNLDICTPGKDCVQKSNKILELKGE